VLGFSVLIITDELEMGAVSQEVSPTWEQVVRAIEPGCDLVLCPTDFDASYQALLQAVRQGRIPQERIDESCRRIIATKLNILA
jgi:beta-N-acetylhexosaminidase